jgi:sugar lactone lactonase YvrE
LFVSNTLAGIGASTTTAVDRGDVVRLSLTESATRRPTVSAERRVASGFPEQTDPATLVRGPSGLALSTSGTLYVADTVGNRIVSIPDALAGSGSGAGTTLSRGGQLADPVGLALAPNGDLLATNGGNGKIVEITASGRQVGDYYADQDVDQDPPGAGELAGLAVDQAGTGVLFVKGEAGTLDRLHA